MSAYDYEDDTGINFFALILNAATILVLLATLCLGSVFFILFVNPYSSLNPFPPTPLPTRFATFTASPPAAQQLEPSWTPRPPTDTPPPTETNTPRPTSTPIPTATPFVLISLTPVTVTSAPPAGGPAFIARGEPLYIQNFAHSELDCNWMGVAGHVFDMSGAPISLGIVIVLGGSLGGQPVHESGELTTLPNTAPQYGPGAFEFKLADEPIDSTGTLYLQLLDQARLPLSDRVFFDTFADCNKNLILIDFQQVRQP